MKRTWIETWDELQRLGPEWNDLLRMSRSDSIFLTWEWIRSCCEATGCQAQPKVLVLREDHSGRLLCVAPFYRSNYRWLGLFKVRILQLLPDIIKGSEYLDIIAAEGSEESAYDEVASALDEIRHSWDGIWIRRVATWTGASERLSRAFLKGRFNVSRRTILFSSFKIPSTFEEFEKSLAPRQRSNLRKATRDAYSSPRASLKACEKPSDISAMLESLFDLHSASWRSRGQAGAFERSPTEAEFYRRFVPIAHEKGWLRMYSLDDGESVRAVQLGFLYDKMFCQLQEGFDPNGPKGVGNALRGSVIKSLIEEHAVDYDFLGGYSEHKRRWTAKEKTGSELLIGGRTLRGKIIIGSRTWPSGKYFTRVVDA